MDRKAAYQAADRRHGPHRRAVQGYGLQCNLAWDDISDQALCCGDFERSADTAQCSQGEHRPELLKVVQA
jgi:hypothetical protein